MNTPKLTKEELARDLTADKLAELLVAAMESLRLATENLQKMTQLTVRASERIQELESKCLSIESELLLLRNRP